MAFESVRGYVQLASGLGEMTMAKAMEAAQGLLALPGADEVSRKVVQASTLAEELLDAARSNRANLVALVQGEVESALKRADVARVADLEAARAALAGVNKELADLKTLVVTTGTSAVAGASRSARGRSGAVSTTARPAAAPTAAAAAGPSPAPAARQSAARQSAARKSAVTKSAPATKAAAKKTAAKKAAPAKKAAAKKATATTATTSTATKATTKTTTRKRAAKKATS